MVNRSFFFFAIFLSLISCQKEVINSSSSPSNFGAEIKDFQVPASFDFRTVEVADLQVQVRSLKDNPLPGVRVNIYDRNPEKGDAALLESAFTNSGGYFNTLLRIPSYLNEVHIVAQTAGINNYQVVAVKPQMQVSFGGPLPSRNLNLGKTTGVQNLIPAGGKYYYMGAYSQGSTAGLPSYLEDPGDVLSQAFLDDVNASLPEGFPVPDYNPEYLTTGNELDVVVEDLSDVWVTFVTEGAGYKNALGFFVFDSDNPPASANDIDSIFIIMPNTSLNGAGGKLNPGDKVKLGTFPGGKTISWVLFQNAWNGSGVNVNGTKFYSKSDFNTVESDPNKRQHTVQLSDIGRQLLLNGFEDLTRSVGSDNDFNDLVFYVSANPWENISIGEIPAVTPNTDCDNDGVSDEADDFPCDALRAVRNTYRGTLAYEDLWPSQGDYDFNDLVVDYEIDHILNSVNKVVEIEADWTVKAVGAGFKNGFGWSFDGLSPNVIQSVSGSNLSEAIISTASNGTEANQNDATVIAFDNVYNIISASGNKFVNTIIGETYVNPVTLSNVVVFTEPQVQANIGLPPYNPFLIANGNRAKEVHLADEVPSDLADQSLFGSGADATDPASAYYYKTSNGLPWAIHLPESFAYPKEYTAINEAYLNFGAWATSGGSSNTDWFKDMPAYRNQEKIYN